VDSDDLLSKHLAKAGATVERMPWSETEQKTVDDYFTHIDDRSCRNLLDVFHNAANWPWEAETIFTFLANRVGPGGCFHEAQASRWKRSQEWLAFDRLWTKLIDWLTTVEPYQPDRRTTDFYEKLSKHIWDVHVASAIAIKQIDKQKHKMDGAWAAWNQQRRTFRNKHPDLPPLTVPNSYFQHAASKYLYHEHHASDKNVSAGKGAKPAGKASKAATNEKPAKSTKDTHAKHTGKKDPKNASDSE
jgi:hypothetical protein